MLMRRVLKTFLWVKQSVQMNLNGRYESGMTKLVFRSRTRTGYKQKKIHNDVGKVGEKLRDGGK